MKTWAGYLASPLLILLFCCTSPTHSGKGEVVFIGEPQWYMFQTEEWHGYKEYYVRTFGEIQVTATVQNIGTGTAGNLYLCVSLFEDKEETTELCSGEVFITPQLEAGARHSFVVNYKFEYCKQVMVKGVKLSLKWR